MGSAPTAPLGHSGITSVAPSTVWVRAAMIAAGDVSVTCRPLAAVSGNGTATVHTQIVAEVLGVPSDSVVLHASDTALLTHDTGAFGSAGTVVGGRALHRRGGLMSFPDYFFLP